MKRLIWLTALVAIVATFVGPAAAYAAESEYARLTAGYTSAYSPATTYLWKQASQGSRTFNPSASMSASIQSKRPNYSWVTRSTVTVPGNGGTKSSSVGSNGYFHNWRLKLSNSLGLAAGDGTLTAKD